MNPYYRDYSEFLASIFEGKVQKISVNAGLTCPNRDGTLGTGGCAYCNNSSFSPDYAIRATDIAGQIRKGKEFFARKYPSMRYLAYFQSYTSTNGSLDRVMEMFRTAVADEEVVGLIVGTRPDCMPGRLLRELADMNRTLPVIVEYGAESSHDATLGNVNRCHTWAQTVDAVNRTHEAGIPVGLHFILGLPGETRSMMLDTVRCVNDLPVSTVKFHQLQILRSTPLAARYEASPFPVFTLDEYIGLCAEIVGLLRPDIAIDRFVSQAPEGMLIAPRWGLKNYQFTNLLNAELGRRAQSADSLTR